MTSAEFCRAAEQAKLPPVVLVHGADPQAVDDALRIATRGLLKDATAEAFDREVLDGDTIEVEAIVNAALTLPVVAARRLVAVRRSDALPARAQAPLAAYIARANPSACLLLLAAVELSGPRDRRHWLLGIRDIATVDLDPKKATPLGRRVRERAQQEGLAVSDEAVRLLVQLVGEDPLTLLGEIRKAALAGGPDNMTVGRREVEAVVGEHRLAGIFDLPRLVVEGKTGPALRTLDRLLATEEPVRVLYFITRELQAGLQVMQARLRGQPVASLARVLFRPPESLKPLEASSLTSSPAALARAMERCWRTEERLKSGGEPHAEMVALVTELCGTQAAVPPARRAG
jgi:DNA polymerase-3 subunit delta